jgi:hypothetical protein
MASKAQKALKAGPSKIGAKARAAANKLKSSKSEDKVIEPSAVHSPLKKSPVSTEPPKAGRPDRSTDAKGKHRKEDYTAAKKNASAHPNAPSIGKHSRETAAARKKDASKPPQPKSSGISSIKEAISARKKVRGR